MKQPPLIIPDTVDVPEAACQRLSNGVRLYTIASDDFEVLRVTFVFQAGSAMQERPFSASATANLLAEGSDRMSAQAIAEKLDFLGSYFEVSTDRDYAYISFCSLSKFASQTLAIAAEIILRPIFPTQEVDSYCAKRRQQLSIERTKVDLQAREEFSRAMFGATHPYGVSYSEQEYNNLTQRDIVNFYQRFYTAENCFVVCSGRITEAECQAVRELTEQLPSAPSTQPRTLPIPTPRPVGFVEHPEALQSSIRLGRLLFPRSHPDFLGMQVVATTLGGYFGSRLMQNLRTKHGYTYGVVAAMVNLQQAGYFATATQVGTEVTADALQQMRLEIERLRTEPMPAQELALVKNIMIGEMMRILDGPFGIADVSIENILCDRGNEVITENLRQIQQITTAQVQHLAQQYLAPEDLVTVVAAAVRPQGL